MLSHSASGDLTGLFEDFFDTSVGQKIEPASYRAICERLDCLRDRCWRCQAMGRELDAAQSAGLATTLIAREGLQTVAMRFALISRHEFGIVTRSALLRQRHCRRLGQMEKMAKFTLETRDSADRKSPARMASR
jgi:hypothetical protein